MRNRRLDQYFTPEWAAEALVSQFFPELTARDLVLEPSCGRGSFLKAIPDGVPAVGVEIDPELAAEARSNSGRQVVVGDFRTVDVPAPTHLIGNPPFDMTTFDGFLRRAHEILPAGGRCGFLLPAYAVQTPSRVLRWKESWSIDQALVPRTLFQRLSLPLVFLMFAKERPCILTGFALYEEAQDITSMPAKMKLILNHGRAGVGVWQAVVAAAVHSLGGDAELADIYSAIEPRRPTGNQWWREKVRQTLQRHFVSGGRGRWKVRAAA
jgi:hypothetical protein